MGGLDGVSIHAPVWGATLYSNDFDFDTLVSIHAPVWGATYKAKTDSKAA